MTQWPSVGIGACNIMALALFFAGLLSWYDWSANVHITGLLAPMFTFSMEIWDLEQRTATLGGHYTSPWLAGIPLMAVAVLLWRQCEARRHGATRPGLVPL